MKLSDSEHGVQQWGGQYDPAQVETEASCLQDAPLAGVNHELKDEMLCEKLTASLVKSIAQRYSDSCLAFPDLIREGRQGLAYALENFEIEGGFRFSSYATRCIRRHIERAITMQLHG